MWTITGGEIGGSRLPWLTAVNSDDLNSQLNSLSEHDEAAGVEAEYTVWRDGKKELCLRSPIRPIKNRYKDWE